MSYDKERKKYQSYINIKTDSGKKKMIALGRYPTALEAAQVRDAEVVKRGLPDPLNFPPS